LVVKFLWAYERFLRIEESGDTAALLRSRAVYIIGGIFLISQISPQYQMEQVFILLCYRF